jgi:hypothetical protein
MALSSTRTLMLVRPALGVSPRAARENTLSVAIRAGERIYQEH